ncbi:phospholipid carrier-dependent glycosyltransferase [Steroidobacter flavus]|uniref:Phospholipid carrier-dependent glycosyltransferase n=1 Tax=Steroidobacter flavus TaxID=1842136 RepID=A0ABV8SNG9_9GAMM
MKRAPESVAVVAPRPLDLLIQRWLAPALIAFGVVLWFATANYRTLTEPDEGRYAEIPREMVASGDWITPHLNAMPYLEKPPLQYWATALAYRVFGFDPWVSRLWSQTLGLLGIVVTYLLGRTLWDRRAGMLAALILASCPLYFVVAHINTLDIGLAFFLNAALACFIVAQRAAERSPAERRWMWLCWLALAAGFLQKGLVALVLPGLTLCIYSLIYKDVSFWRRLHPLAGVLIVAALTLPWLVLVSARNPEFLNFFFLHEHLARFTTTTHRRAEPWWYFLAILFVGVIPWLVTMVRAVIAKACTPAGGKVLAAERLLLVWAVTVVVFFSLSGSKLAPYIVPAMMPLALLAGNWLRTRETPDIARSIMVSASIFCTLLACSSLIIVALIPPGIKRTAYLQIGEWGQMAAVIGMASVVGCLILRRQNVHGAIGTIAAGFVAALTVLICGSNSIELTRGRQGLAAEVAPHLGPDTPFYCVGMYWQTLPFQLRRTCTAVQYRGELGLQFDPQRQHWIENVDEFVPRWNEQVEAVAIVNPKVWDQLVAADIQAKVVVRDAKVVVMVRR